MNGTGFLPILQPQDVERAAQVRLSIPQITIPTTSDPYSWSKTHTLPPLNSPPTNKEDFNLSYSKSKRDPRLGVWSFRSPSTSTRMFSSLEHIRFKSRLPATGEFQTSQRIHPLTELGSRFLRRTRHNWETWYSIWPHTRLRLGGIEPFCVNYSLLWVAI